MKGTKYFKYFISQAFVLIIDLFLQCLEYVFKEHTGLMLTFDNNVYFMSFKQIIIYDTLCFDKKSLILNMTNELCV